MNPTFNEGSCYPKFPKIFFFPVKFPNPLCKVLEASQFGVGVRERLLALISLAVGYEGPVQGLYIQVQGPIKGPMKSPTTLQLRS